MSVLGKAHYVARERMDIVGRRISVFSCHGLSYKMMMISAAGPEGAVGEDAVHGPEPIDTCL
jgi:hypothetical protein